MEQENITFKESPNDNYIVKTSSEPYEPICVLLASDPVIPTASREVIFQDDPETYLRKFGSVDVAVLLNETYSEHFFTDN